MDKKPSQKSPKPRVLVLTSTFPKKAHNGEPQFVFELSQSLVESFEMRVLTQHRPGAAETDCVGGMDIVRYRYGPEQIELLSENGGMSNALKSNRLLLLVLPVFLLSQILAILRSIRSFQPDVIHAHWIIPQGLCAAIALLLFRKKPKLLITSHGGDLYGYSGLLFRKMKNWALRQSNQFSVVSEAMRKYSSGEFNIPPDSISVFPMGTALDTIFVCDSTVSRVKGQLIFVGRLVEKKGLTYLIKAISELARAKIDVKLLVVGSGPELSNLEEECETLGLKNLISFMGRKSHLEIASLLRQSELAIFPFTQADSGDMEGLGLVVIEAMGCMCPVIVGNVPAIHDTVSHEKTGFIVDPTDTENFAHRIASLHENSDLRKQIAKAGYEFARNNYSWTRCADNYRQAFTDLLDPKFSDR